MRLLYLLLLCLLATSCVFGPLGTSKRAIKQLEKGEYVKSQKLVSKAIEKDSLLPAALYAKSRLLVSYDSHQFYDSAYYFILRAQNIYDTLAQKEREKHQKQGFDSLAFQKLKTNIDSLAFEHALRENSEEGYNEFLRKYPTARQVLLAKAKRNALAFAKAKKENTYQGYKDFMEKYPEAVQVTEARERYEKLYFDKSTADGKVSSYIRFLEKNPDTPYRKEAEQQIFEVMTSEHSFGGYQLYLRNYPDSHLRQKAINYAYHVAKAQNVPFPDQYMSDSLQEVKALEPFALLAFMQDSKFGFMNTEAKPVIKPKFNKIEEDYKCEATTSDFLQVENRLEGRNGAVITNKSLDEIIDLGYGLLAVKQADRWGVLHKTGDWLTEMRFQQVKLINGNILVLKSGNQVELRTISKRLLIQDEFDEVYQQGPYIIFEKGDRFEVKASRQLMAAVDNSLKRFEFLFNDYEILPDGNIWLASDYGETIMDSELREIIPYQDQSIEPLKQGFLVRENGQADWYDKEYKLIKPNLPIQDFNKTWLATEQDTIIVAYNFDFPEQPVLADSVKLIGSSFMKSYEGDSTFIYFKNGRVIYLDAEVPLKVLSEGDNEFLLISGENQSVFNADGSLIARGSYDEISLLGGEYLIYNKRNKKGALSVATGKVVIDPKYEAIGNYSNGNVSLLRNKRFGMYHQKTSKIIPAEYEKNLLVYNDSVLIAQKDEKQFLITPENESINPEGFDEVNYWSDSVAFVRQEENWRLFNLNNRTLSDLSFVSFSYYEVSAQEQLVLIRSNDKYGILSNVRGEIISPTFNDIVILPTGDKPIFFTEKHIQEAAFFVVIYYDIEGNILRKQVFEADDYDRLYCDN